MVYECFLKNSFFFVYKDLIYSVIQIIMTLSDLHSFLKKRKTVSMEMEDHINIHTFNKSCFPQNSDHYIICKDTSPYVTGHEKCAA